MTDELRALLDSLRGVVAEWATQDEVTRDELELVK